MIHLMSVAVQATTLCASGQGSYDAARLSNWVIKSWSGVGSLSLELVEGVMNGTLLERYLFRLTLAYLMDECVEEAWKDFVSVMEATGEVETNETCSICFEEVGKGVQLNCEHVYHEQCIGTWFRKKTTCPMCRYDILTPYIANSSS